MKIKFPKFIEKHYKLLTILTLLILLILFKQNEITSENGVKLKGIYNENYQNQDNKNLNLNKIKSKQQPQPQPQLQPSNSNLNVKKINLGTLKDVNEYQSKDIFFIYKLLIDFNFDIKKINKNKNIVKNNLYKDIFNFLIKGTNIDNLPDFNKLSKKKIIQLANYNNIEYTTNTKLETVYNKIKIKLYDDAYNLVKKENKKLNQKNELDIDKFNTSFNDYLKYQEERKKNINLIDIGNMVNKTLNVLGDQSNDDDDDDDVDYNDNTLKRFNNKKSLLEGFQSKRKNNPTLVKNSKLKNNKNKSNKVNKVNKVSKNIKLTIDDLKDDKNMDEVDDDEDLDDTLIKYLKYVFKRVFDISLNMYNKYIGKIYNIDKITQDNQTMIGGGILLIIFSMGLYFIDITK